MPHDDPTPDGSLPRRRPSGRAERLPLLLFRIGDGRFGLDLGRVTEVVPLAELRALPGSPEYVSGLLDHRGTPVPVVDLCRLSLGRAAAERLGTRIILVRHPSPGRLSLLGLVAEAVTDTAVFDRDEFVPPGVDYPGGAHLGYVRPDPEGMLQLVDVDGLLPPEVYDLLFWPHSETS
jgi:chemotaxis-related protein WspB